MININSLYEIKSDTETRIIRVLWISGDWVYVIEPSVNKVPNAIRISEFEYGNSKGNIEKIEQDNFMRIINVDSLPQKYIKMRDDAYALIKDLVNDKPHIFYSEYRNKVIKAKSLESGISQQSILNYLKKFWSRGQIPDTLIPDYLNCGSSTTSLSCQKRGRRRADCNNGTAVTEKMQKIFEASLNKYYFNTRQNSLRTAYNQMLKEYYTVPDASVPSFGQFRYYFEKNRNYKKEISSRKGLKDYLKNNREILGTSRDDVLAPGTFEIDSTIADIYLVSRLDRNLIVGRPTVYVLIDKFSNYIGGIYVGLESSSYVAASMCILNCLSDKVTFCHDYGIDITPEQWNINGLPSTIIADRGELEGLNIENIIERFGIVVKNTPPYRGELKSSVERFFGYINEYTKPILTGLVDATAAERGDIDYRLKAKLDLYEFTQVIIQCVLHYNNAHVIKNYSLTQDMIRDHLTPIPSSLWVWGIANRGSNLINIDMNLAKSVLLCKDTAVITAKGIKFRGLYYASENMIREQLFVKARIQGREKVEVRFDPRNLNLIYVWDSGKRDYELCELLPSSKAFENRYIEEVENFEDYQKTQRVQWEKDETDSRIRLDTQVQSIVNSSNQKYNEENSDKMSKSKKLKGIRENRELEKSINRNTEAIRLATDSSNQVSHSITKEENTLIDNTDILELIRNEQEQNLKSMNIEGNI